MNKEKIQDFLSGNSEDTSEKKPIKKQYLVSAWLFIFFFEVFIVWLGWNHSISSIFNFSKLSFLEAFFLYTSVKTLSRGLFSL